MRVAEILTDLPDEARRLLHGRGGLFPTLEQVAVDWFAPVLLVTLYADSPANHALVAELRSAACAENLVECLVVQRRYLPGAPKEAVYGTLPPAPLARESGLRYHLSLERNQNHGFFLDMRPGREWIRANSSERRVLNLFAYTCSLSVAAIAGGASSVANVDMASGALATGRANHRLNFDDHTCRRVEYLPHDVFKSWGKLRRGGPYELIIIDPPSNQPGSFVAERDYAKIVRRLPELTSARYKVLACLNSPHHGGEFLSQLFAGYRLSARLGTAPGFEDARPEEALKLMVFDPG